MSYYMTRRKAMTAGVASSGMLLGASCSQPEQTETTLPPRISQSRPLIDVWGEDFLMQWSPPGNVKRDLTPGSSPIRISCEAFRLRPPKKMSYPEQIKAIRDAGYTGCEAGSAGWDYSITDSQIRELQAILKEHDVLFYTLHTWVNIIHPDPSERQKNQKHVAQAVEMADRLGMNFILTHTGGCDPKSKDRPHKDNWTRQTWEMSVAATKQNLNDTAGSKVNLAFEAVNSCNNNTPKSHVRLKEDVGDERVKVMLDPSNMLHAGTIFRTTELINECFDLLGEDIMYAHAKDQIWTRMMPSIEGVTLGEGTMDYELYLARLSRLKYSRALLIEHLSNEQYPPSKKFLEDTAAKVGVTIYS